MVWAAIEPSGPVFLVFVLSKSTTKMCQFILHPLRSSDSNLIENCWSILVHKVYKGFKLFDSIIALKTLFFMLIIYANNSI